MTLWDFLLPMFSRAQERPFPRVRGVCGPLLTTLCLIDHRPFHRSGFASTNAIIGIHTCFYLLLSIPYIIKPLLIRSALLLRYIFH